MFTFNGTIEELFFIISMVLVVLILALWFLENLNEKLSNKKGRR